MSLSLEVDDDDEKPRKDAKNQDIQLNLIRATYTQKKRIERVKKIKKSKKETEKVGKDDDDDDQKKFKC